MTQPSPVLTCKTQEKNPAVEFFKSTIRDAGITLSQNEAPNVVTQEQALVVRNIDNLLDQTNTPDAIDKFLRGFKTLIKKDKYFSKALLPTLFKQSGNEDINQAAYDIQQDSLFRIFLKINRLQNKILEILFDDLTSIASDDSQDTTRVRLLLDQIRYLPFIQSAETFTTKLLDIIEVAPYPLQVDILDVLPEVLPDSQLDKIAKALGNMLDSSDELSSPIIDCLNCLGLDQDTRAQIQDIVLAKMMSGTCVHAFPVLLDFLLTDLDVRSLPGILLKIRRTLNSLMGSAEMVDKENESTQIVVFHRLQKALVMKIVADAWLGVISNIKIHTDHKPVDLLILFMLHFHAKQKKRTVEATFRQRIKNGILKCSLLEQLFANFFPPELMRNYFNTIIEIGSSLLRTSNHPLISEFAATLFKLAFTNEHTQRTYRQDILENLIILVASSDQKSVTTILNIFVDLVKNIAETPQHAVILMRLLEKVDGFDLKNVELMFEVLCALTCKEESLRGLKEELHMIVRKQLSSQKRQLKHCGVVSAVVMAKYVAATEEEQSEVETSEESTLNISKLPAAAREAAAILELVTTSISGCPELLGLYYDQLAAMLFKCDNLDKHFQAWLAETTTSDFQNVFVADTICADFNDLQFSMQYNLNTTDEVETPIGVNIAELTLRSSSNTIITLAPHFRFLRLLHFRQQNGDLSSIDALLGCGVVLPKTDNLDSLGVDQRRQVADCLFHCINWFRETIGAFVTQKSKKLRYKVVERLGNLLVLEELLNECLDGIPEHKLPLSYFDSSIQSAHSGISPVKELTKVKPPRKKLKSAEVIENSVAKPSTSKKKPTEERIFKFREMDTDVLKLLKYPLSRGQTLPSSEQVRLTVDKLDFLLEDFAGKLARVTQNRHLGMAHLNMVDPLKLVGDCNILANINQHLLVIYKDLSEDDTLKKTFGIILTCLSVVFAWPGFQHTNHQDCLRGVLRCMRQDTSMDISSINHLAMELVDRMTTYADGCVHLSQAVNLVKIMEALHTISPNPTVRPKIAKTAGKLLEKRWDLSTAANIDALARSYLSCASTKTLCGLVGTLQEQAPQLKTKTDALPMLESISRSNFHVLYRNFCACLHERVKVEIQNLTNAQHLVLWRTTALTMQGLMTVVKVQDSKSNLISFLKKCIAILKIFLSHGIPILEIELRSKPDQVVEILKMIQSNTRFLHHLCCFSKLNKESSLVSYVPQFRLTLETLVYRVKAALVGNGCSEAFWMGNLKNRDLNGEDILSQSTTTTAGEEEEDEVMEEDSCEEEEDKSGSEVFD